jgi:hypothetical protein
MKDLLRDELESQILQDSIKGDTTVLAEILNQLPDKYIYNCLGDAEQAKFPDLFRFSCNNCGGGFSRDEMVFGDDVDLCKDCSL